MILLPAIWIGLSAGILRAIMGKRGYRPPAIRMFWLVLLAFLPQGFLFYWLGSRASIPDTLASSVLVASQALLLVFAWRNRVHPGFWVLIVGLVLNFVVIVLNGGLMPISPDTLNSLVPDAPPEAWQVGSRLGAGKGIVLPQEATQMWWLSDRFTLPAYIPSRAAFSVGDVLIAAGAFWLLWSMGGPRAVRIKR